MATLTVNCGSFNKTSKSGNTAYGSLVNFSIPAGAGITGCSVSFTTQGSSGQTNDRAFSINGTRAHSSGSWAQAGALNAYLLQPGNNTFRVTLRSKTGTLSSPGECWWSISGITLYITYNEGSGGGGGSTGGGGPVVISPSSIDAGAGSVTVTCPAESGIWHMINWTFGSKSGSWSHPWEAGGTHTLNIPLSWIEEMPTATSKSLAIRVRRSTTPAMPYSYATDQTTNVTIKVPASVVPSISDFTATLVPNGVPSTIAGYVQNKSKVTLAMTASGGSYSSIASYEISGGGISGNAATGTFGPFNLSGDVVFTAKVTDGRGRTATRQVAIEIMPYTAPTFSSPEAWRSNYDGVKNQKGTYVRLKSGASFSSLEEQNAVTLKGRVYIKGGEAPAWEDMTPDTELILGGGALLFTRTYIAQIQVSDLLESRITEFIIPTKKTGISIMAGMRGIAFGKSAETPDISDFAWPISAPNVTQTNIFHNWDFRNPINQRGVSGTISTGTYFYDRWIRNSGTVTTNAAYLTVDLDAIIEQRIEGNLLAGKTVTVTVKVGTSYISGSGVFPTSAGTASITLTGFGTATLGYNADYMFIRLTADAARNLVMCKLEMGTVSTLAFDPPMDHAIELPKCQRFFAPIIGSLPYFANVGSESLFLGHIGMPVKMRVSPTFTFGPCTIANIIANMQSYISGVVISDNRDIGEVHTTYVFSGGYNTPLILTAYASADL